MGHAEQANPDVLVLLRRNRPDDTKAHDLGLWL